MYAAEHTRKHSCTGTGLREARIQSTVPLGIHTGTHSRTRERTHTGNIRMSKCAKGHYFARKLRIAQLLILTISGHVIAVSAQRDKSRASDVSDGAVDPRQVSFVNFFVDFFLIAFM